MEPLTRLTKDNVKFEWLEEQQTAFDLIKKKCAEAIMLVYPRYDRPFDLHPDACDMQVGAFLLQDGRTIGCFSRKMNSAQQNYPMTDKELLAIVSGLRHFDIIIRGARIRCYCDHKNLTHGDTTLHASQRALRQKIAISQDYNAEITHIAGEDNPGGDGMSRLPTKAFTLTEKEAFSITEPLKVTLGSRWI